MSIVAALDKVLFFNASSKYSVLRMKTEDSSVPTEARSPYRYHDHLIRFTAVGIELPQTDTVKIEMDGEWKDGKYGLQLQVDHWQEIVPPTLEGVRNYLASGLLKGIGEKTADAIIEKFGVNALEILEHQPDRLLEIRGITKERLCGNQPDACPDDPAGPVQGHPDDCAEDLSAFRACLRGHRETESLQSLSGAGVRLQED